jgi:hypothetical protein
MVSTTPLCEEAATLNVAVQQKIAALETVLADGMQRATSTADAALVSVKAAAEAVASQINSSADTAAQVDAALSAAIATCQSAAGVGDDIHPSAHTPPPVDNYPSPDEHDSDPIPAIFPASQKIPIYDKDVSNPLPADANPPAPAVKTRIAVKKSISKAAIK